MAKSSTEGDWWPADYDRASRLSPSHADEPLEELGLAI